MSRWILPPHIDEVTPENAWQLETLRRRLLDLYRTWGYDFVAPTMVEHLDSLLSGGGADLEAQTVTFTDPASGQLLGIRADITPQAARTDATFYGTDKVSRLCYLGNILRATPDGLGDTRNPIQVGVELFGHDGLASDVEVITLALNTLDAAGVPEPLVTLSHLGILEQLFAHADADLEQEYDIFHALQTKSEGAVRTASNGLPGALVDQFVALVSLYGPAQAVLEKAKEVLLPELSPLLDYLADLEKALSATGDVRCNVDLGDVPGYGYKTGLAFSIVAPGHDKELIRGGRYEVDYDEDEIVRPATGFSSDLKALLAITEQTEEVVIAPQLADPALAEKIAALRADGTRVIISLTGDLAESAQATHQLVAGPSGWEVTSL